MHVIMVKEKKEHIPCTYIQYPCTYIQYPCTYIQYQCTDIQYRYQCSKLRVHPAPGMHHLVAACTHFGTCAPTECTLFLSISIHFIGLNTK